VNRGNQNALCTSQTNGVGGIEKLIRPDTRPENHRVCFWTQHFKNLLWEGREPKPPARG
jgi:hypothetical protein